LTSGQQQAEELFYSRLFGFIYTDKRENVPSSAR